MTRPNKVRPLRLQETKQSFRLVFIRDLVIPWLIGVHRHEHEGKQRVRINIELKVAEDDRPIDDSLPNVVCYEALVDGIRDLADSGHVNLVETLADRIAERCLADGRVSKATVRVEKLDVFDDVASVGIEIERTNPSL